MEGQMSIYDCFPELCLKPGDYVTEHGAVICHIMRKGFIGRLIVMDKSTQSRERWQVGRLEKYFECRGVMRAVVYDGKAQRSLIDFYPGTEIFELRPRQWVNGKGWS